MSALPAAVETPSGVRSAGGVEALRGRGDPHGGCADTIAAWAEYSLLLEVSTWPKPGLVSDVDNGSHTDMDAAMFRRSAAAIRPYFRDLAAAGADGAEMAALRSIGVAAERAMLEATAGVNTHRGAIFGMGLLCAAAGLRAAGHIERNLTLGRVVAARWGCDIAGGPRLPFSHGAMARRRHGAGGAPREAANGFPSVFDVGLPTLRAAPRSSGGDAEAARVQAFFALLAVLEDTNLLHRAGAEGLRYAQQEARHFLRDGGVSAAGWRARAAAVHRSFVARRLSPGGAADMLAMSLFVHRLDSGRVLR